MSLTFTFFMGAMNFLKSLKSWLMLRIRMSSKTRPNRLLHDRELSIQVKAQAMIIIPFPRAR